MTAEETGLGMEQVFDNRRPATEPNISRPSIAGRCLEILIEGQERAPQLADAMINEVPLDDMFSNPVQHNGIIGPRRVAEEEMDCCYAECNLGVRCQDMGAT